MYKFLLIASLALGAFTSQQAAATEVSQQLIKGFQQAGARTPSAERGKALWTQKNGDRSCSLCHTENLANTGKHHKTGKLIKPMAPSINSERLTDAKKVNKWLRRNCKWTLGRECTAQEKADVLSWISRQ